MIPPPTSSGLTPAQAAAVAARGNVLVMAGAGTGKTHTLIQRILACVHDDSAALDQLLIVTFTEAAAAEMRQRLRRALEEISLAQPEDPRSREQLALFDTAHIGTLHSFCLKLVREHFHELGLDPDLAVLETGEAHLRAEETLEEILQGHYGGEAPLDLAVQSLIQIHGGGRDEKIRALILRLHHYAQTRPDAAGWLARQIASFNTAEPVLWQGWLIEAITGWRAEWLPRLESLRTGNIKAAEVLELLRRLPSPFTREQAAEMLTAIEAASEVWPPRQKTALLKPLKTFFDDAAFLGALTRCPEGHDPLAEDWDWTRQHMATLLELARDFSQQFARRKLEDGVVDFHDLEQFSLTLLWDFAADQPTSIARRWRERLQFVFVDEYQDINAAQDKIISALSRDGAAANRFLVGDVKQSIYRFRLADPKIFRAYARGWRDGAGQALALSENFRSREGLLNWVNALFQTLMREEFGGVNYDAEARLLFGSPATRTPLAVADKAPPRGELLLLRKPAREDAGPSEEPAGDSSAETFADLDNAEKEARLLAGRLVSLRAEAHDIWDGAAKSFRPVEWRDMAVLLRAPGGKAEVYARAFARAGIPLVVERGGFYTSAEIADLLNVLQLLDNPLQDVPAIAVLRSPLVGLSLDELAQIRLTVKREPFWTALNRSHETGGELTPETRQKIAVFLERYTRWRQLARQAPLGPCLETILTETNYSDWLASRPRGAQRQANVRRLLGLAEQFDQFQQQGLHRFLKFIEVQQTAEVEPEVALALAENAVRLMSIHQSKGLEFPVVAVADLAKAFNTQDRRAEIIFDETYGLCPRVKPPSTGRSYPSLPHWLAQQGQRREQAGEELRLLYVALTRARDTLVLTGSVTDKKWSELWAGGEPITAQRILAANSYADWIGLWFAQQNPGVKGAEPIPLNVGVLSPPAPSSSPDCGIQRGVGESQRNIPPLLGERAGVRADVPPPTGNDCLSSSAATSSRPTAADDPARPAPDAPFPAGLSGEVPHLRWRLVEEAEVAGAAAGGLVTEKPAPPPLDAATFQRLQAVLTWQYPFAAATEYKAKTTVTALRHLVAGTLDDEAQPLFPEPFAKPADRRQLSHVRTQLTAAQIGIAHHQFLQHVRLDQTQDLPALTAEADRLAATGFLQPAERAVLNLPAIAGFWRSPVGQLIRTASAAVRREQAFTARFSPFEVIALLGLPQTAQTTAELAGEFVVIQGVADLLVLHPDQIWLVDFKTDALAPAELADKIRHYEPQILLYAASLTKIYARPVTRRWLHFLALNQTKEL